MDFIIKLSGILLLLSIVISFFRMYIGPGIVDRVNALDQISMIFVCLIILNTIHTGNLFYLDLIVVVSIIISFGTIIIARYLYRKYYDK